MLDRIKNNLAIIGFLISTVVLAILAWLYQRRGQKLGDLVYQLTKERLEAKLKPLKEKVENDKEDYKKSADDYAVWRNRYGALYGRAGGTMPRVPDREGRGPEGT